MKRFLFFVSDHYYPQGGMFDCDGAFEEIEEVLRRAEKIGDNQSAHWLDTEFGTVHYLDGGIKRMDMGKVIL